ncbi:MAG: NADH-quinone oxidoreductase subunit C [Elusimicrobia bacterium]|nr:NADH-quinone oxidoreductase subunit C [Elusimicrobiota bacterium]
MAKKEEILNVLKSFRDKGYDHLEMVSCVDRIKENKFEIVYILSSYGENETVILKTAISRENPQIPSAIPVFENAEPYERELHELFGIDFEGHPRLTPLLLERKYKIPPFRKDFDTRKYVKEVFDEIPFIEDKK